jgi:hypothetical protein
MIFSNTTNSFFPFELDRICSRSSLPRFNSIQSSDTVAWEADFNSGAYKGAQTFDMSPRGHFAFMLVQNNTVAAIAHHNHHHQLRAIAFFDISSRNWQEMIAEC